MRRKLVTTALLGLGFTGAVSAGTLAVFTDADTLGSNAFTTGTVSLGLSPTSALFTVSGMLPGDAVTNPLVVSNNGTAQLRYAMSSSATNADTKNLLSVLQLEIRGVDVTTPGTPCDNFDGASIRAAGALTGNILGDSTQGGQAGDRTLASSASETLCFRVSLPLATGNAYQDATTTATFTFNSEQTANNA